MCDIKTANIHKMYPPLVSCDPRFEFTVKLATNGVVFEEYDVTTDQTVRTCCTSAAQLTHVVAEWAKRKTKIINKRAFEDKTA